MSAPFDPASWVERAEAIGLARVIEDGIVSVVAGPTNGPPSH